MPSDLLWIAPSICLIYHGLLPVYCMSTALQLQLFNDILMKARN